MKKIILALIIIFSLVIALPSCDSNKNSNPEFDLLNDLCNKDFSSYSIDISVESETGDKTTEHYNVSVADGIKTVEYRIERLSTFELENGELQIPSNRITVTEGSLTTDKKGEYEIPKFNFSYDALSSDMIIGRTFKAKIVSIEKFAGITTDIEEATVKVEYSTSSVSTVTITYNTDAGNTVTIQYTFN